MNKAPKTEVGTTIAIIVKKQHQSARQEKENKQQNKEISYIPKQKLDLQ